MHITEEKLEEILSQAQIIEKSEFEEMRKEADRTQRDIINVILGRGDISENFLVETLASFFRVPMTDLRTVEEKKEVVRMIPENFAKKKSLAAFDYDEKNKVLKVAMTDPGDLEVIEYLEVKFGCAIEPYITSSIYLKRAFKQYKEKIGEKFTEIIEDNLKKARTMSGSVDLGKVAKEVPVIAMLDAIIVNAMDLTASDIHFEPAEDALVVRYRVDGIMREILSLPKVIHSFLVARVKVVANLSIDETRKPQDGRFRFSAESGDIDIRVSIMPMLQGEKVEMRLLQPSDKPLSLPDLGLNPHNVELVLNSIKKTYGMILAAGPTGSGKTTSLYTVLHILNKSKVNVMTIEDPVEYNIAGINQIQVNEKAGITFANGLRSIVRQDPDIIMVGEIRDPETSQIAVHAALTGHLVLSTVHTNDAAGTIPRLLDLGVEPFLLTSTLNLIIAQRLVRKICLNCIESYPTPPEIKKLISAQFNLIGVNDQVPETLYRGKGCNLCGGQGYKDRMGIFECLAMSKKISELIIAKADSAVIRDQAIKEGMITMFQDGIRKAESGVTTIEEVLRVILA